MRNWATIFSLGFLTLFVHISRAGAQDIRDGLILLYEFEEGSGATVSDTSGFGSPIDLTIRDPGNTSWGDGFLTVSAPTIIEREEPPQKIYDAVIPVGELSLEAWIRPANASLAGPARIITISNPGNPSSDRNFTIGIDGGAHIQARLRTDSSTINAQPYIDTRPTGDVITEPTDLMHIAYTRDTTGAVTIYVDGAVRSDPAAMQPGDLNAWVETFQLGLAHEYTDPSGTNQSFQGDLYQVAMWNRALAEGEVQQLFVSGPEAPGGMPLLAGDVDGDGDVDLDDYGVIRDNFLSTVEGRADGDLNFDRFVDWSDFRNWKTAFQAAGGNAATIPEPSTVGLVLVAVATSLLGLRRHRREV